MTKHFSLTTKALPQAQKPFRIAEFGAVEVDGSKVAFDLDAAKGVARRFNAAHDEPTDVYGLVITTHENLGASDNAGHFRTLEALPDGLYAHVTWLHGFVDIIQGDTVTAQFILNDVIDLEFVEISRP